MVVILKVRVFMGSSLKEIIFYSKLVATIIKRELVAPTAVYYFIPPCLVCMFIIMTASKMTYVYVAALIVFGAGFHWMQKVAKHYNWWEYAQASVSKRASKYLAKAKLSVD